MQSLRVSVSLLAVIATACVGVSTPRAAEPIAVSPQPTRTFDLPVSRAPFTTVHANWKQRLDQPYVYLEHTGDYRFAGARIVELFDTLRAARIAQAGPPFVLFYDDPAKVPTERLRARVAIPTADVVAQPPAGVQADVLPSTTVVYAFVGGPYSEVPRAYPALYQYLETMHWVENGPLREIYHVSPAEVADFADLVCEVQLPATQSR